MKRVKCKTHMLSAASPAGRGALHPFAEQLFGTEANPGNSFPSNTFPRLILGCRRPPATNPIASDKNDRRSSTVRVWDDPGRILGGRAPRRQELRGRVSIRSGDTLPLESMPPGPAGSTGESRQTSTKRGIRVRPDWASIAANARTAVINPRGISRMEISRSRSVVPRQAMRLQCTAMARATRNTPRIPSDATSSLRKPPNSTNAPRSTKKKQDQNQREGPASMLHRAKPLHVHPMQDRAQQNSGSQQDDDIRHARASR
jgi:hypothetical protein